MSLLFDNNIFLAQSLLLGTWLNPKDQMSLDSAIVDSNERRQYLEIVNGDEGLFYSALDLYALKIEKTEKTKIPEDIFQSFKSYT